MPDEWGNLSDDEYEELRRQRREEVNYRSPCSHSGHIDTGMRRVYCSYCSKVGEWVSDEKGRRIEWEGA
jgi:hypothetical protein